MGRYAYSEGRGRRRRGRGGCLQAFIALAFLGCLAVLVYALALRPLLTRAVADGLAGGPVPTLMPAGAPVPTLLPAGAAPGDPGAAAVEQAGAALPAAVAALPAGEIVVSEADVNGFLAARPEAIAPLDTVSLRFTPAGVVAQIGAYGLSSQASVGLAAEGGQLVVTGVTVDAPLSYVLSGPDLAAALAARLNAELAAQGRRVEDLRVEDGQMVIVTS